jgi:hypothetical protein
MAAMATRVPTSQTCCLLERRAKYDMAAVQANELPSRTLRPGG